MRTENCSACATIDEEDEEYEAWIIKDFDLITYHLADRIAYEVDGSYEIVERIIIPALLDTAETE